MNDTWLTHERDCSCAMCGAFLRSAFSHYSVMLDEVEVPVRCGRCGYSLDVDGTGHAEDCTSSH